jgi:hypothetical protein
MQQIQALRNDRSQPAKAQAYRSTGHDRPRTDDQPPVDFTSERYSAWSATSIFNFVPFSSPGGR